MDAAAIGEVFPEPRDRVDAREKCDRSVDTRSKTIAFETGESLAYDKLLLATGSIPRKLNVPGETLANIFTLRSFADSRALVKACEKASRAVIVGASFIGLESASSLRKRGLQVTVVAPEAVPFERIFGHGNRRHAPAGS